MNAKTGLIALVAVVVGVLAGVLVTANLLPTAATGNGDAGALDTALKDTAEARAEAVHWQSEADQLARKLALKAEAPQEVAAAPVEATAESMQNPPSPMDASMHEELEEYRARDREREDRFAERRGQMTEWRTDMIDRRTNMFTDLIDRTDDQAEQQRWADIEQQMTYARDLYQQMRNAETDEDRTAVREALGENNQTMQNLLKQQQSAVLQRALEAEGINDPEQLAQIQKAVQSSLSDESFQLSGRGRPGRGSRGRGSAWPGRGGSGPSRGGPR